jgi:ubiquinone/menaquinone biosynthesis C-methylase UbiE
MLRAMQRDTRTSRIVEPLFRVWSRVYDLGIFQAYYGRVHDRILALAPAAVGSVLDVGCGTGELLGKLARRWPEARLVGLDISAAMLAQAAAKPFAGEVELVEGSVYELPFPDGSFELVTNTLSSHFYQDFPAAARELARVTAPGGMIVMASIGNGPARLLPGAAGRELRVVGDVVQRSPAEQRRVLGAAGFDVERVESIFPIAWLYVARRR